MKEFALSLGPRHSSYCNSRKKCLIGNEKKANFYYLTSANNIVLTAVKYKKNKKTKQKKQQHCTSNWVILQVMDALWRNREKGEGGKNRILPARQENSFCLFYISLYTFFSKLTLFLFFFFPYFPFGCFCCVLPLIISQHTHSNPHTQESSHWRPTLGILLSSILHITIFKYFYVLFFIVCHQCFISLNMLKLLCPRVYHVLCHLLCLDF